MAQDVLTLIQVPVSPSIQGVLTLIQGNKILVWG